MITIPRRTAEELLSGYLGEEVTVTPDDTRLLAYAQRLHAKCDELGKERDEAERKAELYFQQWADNQSFTQRVSAERDELVADLGCAENDILNWEASRDEAREWARHYRAKFEAWRGISSRWKELYITLKQAVQMITLKE